MEESVFDSWMIKKMIGKGNFGTVYEICKDDEKEAMKVIDIYPQNSDFNEILGIDNYNELEEKIKQVMKEIDMLYYLKGNTHIVNYIDHYVEKKDDCFSLYLKMEYLQRLDQYYDKKTQSEQALSMTYDILDALIVCERKEIVHGDIKPQNIMVDVQGHNKLTDFGIAKVMSDQKVNTYTAAYAAPEIITDRQYTKQSDLYSLGLVIYQMYNNSLLPFMKKGFQKKDAEKIISSRLNNDVPPPANGNKKLNEFLSKALHRDPKERFQSAYDMKDCLYNLEKNDLLPRVAVALPVILAIAIKFNSFTAFGSEATKHTVVDTIVSMTLTTKIVIGVSTTLVVGGGVYTTVYSGSPTGEKQVVEKEKTESQELYLSLEAKKAYETLVNKMNTEVTYCRIDTDRGNPVWYRNEIYYSNGEMGVVQRCKTEVGEIEQYEYSVHTPESSRLITSMDKSETCTFSECQAGNVNLNEILPNFFKQDNYVVSKIFKKEENNKVSITFYLTIIGQITEYVSHEIIINDDGLVEKTLDNLMDENFENIIENTTITVTYSHYNEKSQEDFYKSIELLNSLEGLSQQEVIKKTGFKK